jgi:hypothetical protein
MCWERTKTVIKEYYVKEIASRYLRDWERNEGVKGDLIVAWMIKWLVKVYFRFPFCLHGPIQTCLISLSENFIAEIRMLNTTNVKLLSSAEMAVLNNIDWIFKDNFGKLCAFCGDRTSGSLYIPRKCYRIELHLIPRFQWYKNDYPISNEVTTILKVTQSFLVVCVMHFV